jgi:hypothetical protein
MRGRCLCFFLLGSLFASVSLFVKLLPSCLSVSISIHAAHEVVVKTVRQVCFLYECRMYPSLPRSVYLVLPSVVWRSGFVGLIFIFLLCLFAFALLF